jgi:succinate-acetate transporter protein
LLEALVIFLYYREVTTFTQGTYSLWAILHSLIVIFFMLAARAINKDEKLIKDSNRLR